MYWFIYWRRSDKIVFYCLLNQFLELWHLRIESSKWTLPCGEPSQNHGRFAPEHIRAKHVRGKTRKMSHLKLLRGNFARIFLDLSKNVNKTKFNYFRARTFATQTAPDVECKYLTSPLGEIEVGNETLTEHVFADFELWPDKPCVVSIFLFL